MLIWCWVSHLHCLSVWNFCDFHFYQYLFLLRLICFFFKLNFSLGWGCFFVLFFYYFMRQFHLLIFSDGAIHCSKAICYNYKYYLLMAKLFFVLSLNVLKWNLELISLLIDWSYFGIYVDISSVYLLPVLCKAWVSQ